MTAPAGAASEWLVLLHGTPLSPAVWDGVSAHLSRRGHVLADRLPRGSLTVLPGAAHMSPFTDSAALAELIVWTQPEGDER